MSKENISIKYIREILHYDKDSGLLTWKVRLSSAAGVGDIAGYEWINPSSGKKYINIGLNNKLYKAHRLIWFYIHGLWPDEIDHINGDGTDNRLVNLRNVYRTTNCMNMRMYAANKSGITGVCWDKRHNMWKASIRINKVLINLGYFKSLFDAACARKSANLIYGFHINHGSIRPL